MHKQKVLEKVLYSITRILNPRGGLVYTITNLQMTLTPTWLSCYTFGELTVYRGVWAQSKGGNPLIKGLARTL